MATTTIQISQATREKLARLKAGRRESYDELLNKLLRLVPEGDEEGRYTQAFRVGLLEARLDVKEGRLIPLREAKRRLGL
jgi:Arc/MetJ-type ribon-helix-helix transcriptional regulator